MAWLVVLVPLAGAAAVIVPFWRTSVRNAGLRYARSDLIAVIGAAASLVAAIGAVVAGSEARWSWGGGLTLGLSLDGLAGLVAVLVPAVALPVIAYATTYLGDDSTRPRLLALLLVFVAAMQLLVAADDLLTVLVGWELVSALSWALITHHWHDPDRPRAAAQAFLTTRFGDLGLFAATGLALAAGLAAYGDLGALTGWRAQLVAGGILLAAAAKSAQVPFSPWLFSAMAGPTPVSALLHSATMVAAGAYLLARVTPELEAAAGWLPGAVVAVGLVTALAGGLVASVQDDLKRALAGSTSAQYGFVFVAVGAGSTAAAGAHLVTHAAAKALLFLGAGVAIHLAGTEHLEALRVGRAGRPSAIAVSFGIGALALAAVPPLGAAWTKDEIVAAAVHDSLWVGLGVIVAGGLSALYAARLAVLTFGPGGSSRPPGEGPTQLERAAVVGLAAASIGLGLLWLPGAGGLTERVTDGRLFSASVWELPATLAAAALGLGAVAALDRRHALLSSGVSERLRTFGAGWFELPALARRGVVDPVLALSRGLARFDDRVVDAGVRLVAAIPRAGSRLLSWWGELSFDGTVRAVAGGALRLATVSRRADDDGVDRAVEDMARGTGSAGLQVRRLQTGLAHQYYLIVGVGLIVVVAVAALWR